MRLFDRRAEKQVLSGLLDSIRAGESCALVICGEPGIGKSALLDWAIESAADLRVLRVLAVESEAVMGFAAVHRLLLPVLSDVVLLHEPQRRALQVALGQVSGPPADPFLVGLAVLTLLSDAAVARPVLCVIDDAQWLDTESADVLGFVARRLLADRLGMFFAMSDTPGGTGRLKTLPELRMGGLPQADANKLIAATVGRPVAAEVSRHIVADTAGNPLALSEVTRELLPDQLSGRTPLPEPLPVGRRLEQRFVRRVRELPPDSQTLLLLAAADHAASGNRFWRAATSLRIPKSAAEPAETAELAVFWPEVRFRHPLVRAAVYQAATAGERREVHHALALACDPDHDADARAWHLAAAADGPDEHVAADLVAAAGRVRARGGYAAAAVLLERAALLSPSDEEQGQRRLAAAEAELLAGAVGRAGVLLAQAVPGLRDPLSQAKAVRLEGWVRLTRGHPAEAAPLLLRAARTFELVDPHAAGAAALAAFDAASYAGWSASRPVLQEIARTVDRLPKIHESCASAADVLLRGYATRVRRGPASAVPTLRRAVRLMLVAEAAAELEAHRFSYYPFITAALDTWDDTALEALTERWVRRARESGALITLQTALLVRGMFADVPGGRLAAARAAADESRELAASTGNPGVGGTSGHDLLLALVFAGQEREARAAADMLIRDGRDRRALGQVVFAAYAMGVLELSRGNYEAAADWLDHACENDGPLTASALPDLVEAGVRAGRRDGAAGALGRLTERARASGTPLALGLLARSQALLASHDQARQDYEEAIVQLGRSQSSPQLARTHLLYGEWLRRRRRPREARDQLRRAHDMFDAMGFSLFAERARVELRATGEHARPRETGAAAQLTPQEARIAHLVSRGEANRDIAAQLFISPSTVQYHLRKVFRKLEVTSRTQLALRILQEDVDDSPSIPAQRSAPPRTPSLDEPRR
jgi:DNA-binding CsgD family transcriptional regulator